MACLFLFLFHFLSNDSLLFLLSVSVFCFVCVPLCICPLFGSSPSFSALSLYVSALCFLHLVKFLAWAASSFFFRGRQMERWLLLLWLLVRLLSFQSSSIFPSILFLPATFHWEHHVWQAHTQASAQHLEQSLWIDHRTLDLPHHRHRKRVCPLANVEVLPLNWRTLFPSLLGE